MKTNNLSTRATTLNVLKLAYIFDAFKNMYQTQHDMNSIHNVLTKPHKRIAIEKYQELWLEIAEGTVGQKIKKETPLFISIQIIIQK